MQSASGDVEGRKAGKAADYGSMVAAPEDYQTDAFLDEYVSENLIKSIIEETQFSKWWLQCANA